MCEFEIDQTAACSAEADAGDCADCWPWLKFCTEHMHAHNHMHAPAVRAWLAAHPAS